MNFPHMCLSDSAFGHIYGSHPGQSEGFGFFSQYRLACVQSKLLGC